MLIQEGFDGRIDDVCRVVHDLRGLVHCTSGDMPDLLALVGGDFQIFSQGHVIAIEGCGCDIRHQIGWQLHHGADMADHGPWNGLWIRKVMQALIDLEQDHQRKLLRGSACACGNKGNITGRWCIDLA